MVQTNETMRQHFLSPALWHTIWKSLSCNLYEEEKPKLLQDLQYYKCLLCETLVKDHEDGKRFFFFFNMELLIRYLIS